MAIQFLNAVDLNFNQLEKAAIQNIPSTDPIIGVLGQLIYNVTGGVIKVCTTASSGATDAVFTAVGGAGSYTSWKLEGDTGAPLDVVDGARVDFTGGSGISTVVASATPNTLTIGVDYSSTGIINDATNGTSVTLVDADEFLFEDVSAAAATSVKRTTLAKLKTYIGAVDPAGVYLPLTGGTLTGNLNIERASGDIGALLIKGGKSTVTAVGEVNSEINFSSNDDSVTGGIAGSIKSINESADGSIVGMTFSTFKDGRAQELKEAMVISGAGNIGVGVGAPASLLTIGGNVVSTSKPTAVISDITNGGSLVLRGVSPILSFDKTGAGVPKVLMDAGGLQFKTGTLDAEGDIDMVILPDGKVGIGTDNPSEKLTVNDPVNNMQMRIGSLTAGISPIIRLQGKNAADTVNYFTDIELNAETGVLLLNDPGTSDGSVGQNPVSIDSDGKVGIGTITPDTQLHVKGISSLEESTGGGGTQLRFLGEDSSTHFNFLIGKQFNKTDAFEITPSTAANGITFTTPAFLVQSDGNVGIGTTIPTRKFVVSNAGASGIEIQPNYTTGVNEILSFNRTVGATAYETMRFNAVDFQFQASGATKMTIDSTGKVGIGTDSPTESLSVSGGNIAVNNGNSFIIGGAIAGNAEIGRLKADSGKLHILSESARDIKLGSTTYGDILSLKGSDGNANFSANVLATGMLTVQQSDIGTGETVGLALINGGQTQQWNITSGITNVDNTTFNIRNSTTNVDVLSIASDNDVAIKGNVGISGNLSIERADGDVGALLVKGGNNAVASIGEVNSEINFGSNDTSVTGGVGGSIKSITDAADGSSVGMVFSTFKSDRTPKLKEAMVISGNGKIGVGVAIPSETLDIAGTIKASGFGYVLTPASGDSSTKVATTAFVQSALTGLLEFKGGFNANSGELDNGSGDDLYTDVILQVGDYYVVTTAGDFFGNTATPLTVGDSVIVQKNVPDPGATAAVEGDFTVIQSDTDLATATTVGIGNVEGTANEVGVSYTSGTAKLTNLDKGSSQNIFKTITAPAGGDIVASSNADTLNFTVSGGMTITNTPGTDTINFSSVNDNTEYTAGKGLTLNTLEFDVNVDGTPQTVSSNAVTATAVRTYAVQVDSSDDLVVNVPWVNTIRTIGDRVALAGGSTTGGLTTFAYNVTNSFGAATVALDVKCEVITNAGQTVYADVTRSGATLSVIFSGTVANNAYQVLLTYVG